MAALHEWHKIAGDVSDISFTPDHIARLAVQGRTICIGRHQGRLFAFAATCPHAGAPLWEGRIDGAGNVVCPLHGYRFAVGNGRNTSGEGYYLRHWPVESRPDGIYVGLPPAND